MNSFFLKVVLYADIKVSSVSKRKGYRLRRLLDFFRKNDVLSDLLNQAYNDGFLLVPSIYSDGLARCNSGFYAGQNVLVFKDESVGSVFFISQLSCLIYSVYDPEEKIFFSLEKNEARQAKIFNRIASLAQKHIHKDGVFLGLINGYDRPYHYFYDKLPYVVDISFSGKEKINVLSLRSEAFLSASVLGFDNEVVKDDLKEAYLGVEGFYISPGYPLGFKEKNIVNDNLDVLVGEKFSSSVESDFPLSDSVVVVWFGMCSEKRRWMERDEAYKEIVLKLSNEIDEVFFVFDGLTRPVHVGVDEFCKKTNVQHEINSVKEFVDALEIPLNYVSLVGSCAEEKLTWAYRSDFFISNALTDSMWCSRFARKPGVCYSSAVSYPEIHRQHRHPKSLIIDHEFIKDTGDKNSNWSKMDFSIDPKVFSQLVFDQFDKYYPFK